MLENFFMLPISPLHNELSLFPCSEDNLETNLSVP
jgi:hypothetical protein